MNISSIQRQSLIALGSTICSLTAIGFLSTIYFAHVLGPGPLGAYFLFIAYLGIFNLVGDGGFGGAAVKRISEGKEQNEYFSAFVFVRIALLAVSVTALIWAEPYFKDATSSGIFFWLLLALIISVFWGIAGVGIYGAGKVGIYSDQYFSGCISTNPFPNHRCLFWLRCFRTCRRIYWRFDCRRYCKFFVPRSKISPVRVVASEKPVQFLFLEFSNLKWFIGILLCRYDPYRIFYE